MAVAETTFHAMASRVQVLVVDGPPQAGAVAQRAIAQLESVWSRFIGTSDLTRLNLGNGRPVAVEPATLRLLDTMLQAHELTGGRYDPAVLPALLAAGYVASIDDPGATTTVPPAVGPVGPATVPFAATRVDHDGGAVTLPAGVAIDPGGLGKGLAADLVVAELLARGAAGALVGIGGDLAAAGRSPERGWLVDVEHPLDPSRTLTQLALSGGGVATSSTRSRRWTRGTTEQHHVIDPATGAPSASDLAGVTVFAPCGWQAEAHATALLLGGSADFVSYARRAGIDAIATAVTGEVHATDALEELRLVEVGR